MARELKILITADGNQAKTELAAVDQAIDHVGDSTKTLEKTFDTSGRGMQKAMAAVGAVIGAIGFRALANEAITNTSKIQDAMQTMGVNSAESVQRLIFAAEQGGASLQTVTNAVTTMSERIAEGKLDSVLQAVGLSLDAIKQMQPDQAFIAIADAIRGVPDPMLQTSLAMEAFGRGGKDLLPAIRDGFKEVGAEIAPIPNHVVAMGDSVGDQVNRIQTTLDGLQAQAILPLVNAFTTYVPNSLQVFAAGIATFLPSLESLLLGILAVGGPKAALAMLSSGFGTVVAFLTTTLPGAVMGFVSGAGAAIVTFFTTTLPAAFTAVITFLGPQGLIALGLLALGVIWYKWGDDITRIVKNLYTAIKTWLVDKLAAVWNTVKQKVDAVKGYFSGLYDAVVGNSYIPDMVDGIGREIARLDNVFVKPSQLANQLVGNAFQAMTRVASDALRDLIGKVTGTFSNITDSVIPDFGRRGTSTMAGIGSSFKSTFLASFGAGLGEGLVNLAMKGLSALGNWLSGGEEAKIVNPARDAFFAMFGGYDGLAKQLTAASDGNIADELLKVLFNADTEKAFEAAKEAIEKVLEGAGAGLSSGLDGSPAQAAMQNLGISVEGVSTQVTALQTQWEGWFTAFTDSVTAMQTQWTAWERFFVDSLTAMPALFDPLLAKVAAFTDALNAIPRSIEVSLSINQPSMPDGFHVPSFANEGRVTRPTLAVIGDAPEPEYVLRESTVRNLKSEGGGESFTNYGSITIVANDPRSFLAQFRQMMRQDHSSIVAMRKALA